MIEGKGVKKLLMNATKTQRSRLRQLLQRSLRPNRFHGHNRPAYSRHYPLEPYAAVGLEAHAVMRVLYRTAYL